MGSISYKRCFLKRGSNLVWASGVNPNLTQREFDEQLTMPIVDLGLEHEQGKIRVCDLSPLGERAKPGCRTDVHPASVQPLRRPL